MVMHWRRLDSKLRENTPLESGPLEPPVVLATAERWNKLTDRAPDFAMRLSPDVMAVHLTVSAGPEGR